MKKRESNPTKPLFIFIAIVLLLALISILYKGFVLIKKSTFTHDTINILLVGNEVNILHIDNSQKKLLNLVIPLGREEFLERGRLASSIAVGIPLDGVLIADEKHKFGDKLITFDAVFHSFSGSKKYELENINAIDVLKMYLSINSFKTENKIFVQAEKDDGNILINADNYELLRDRTIFNEKMSIEIVNATGIDGLGARVSSMLSNAGYNVVATENGANSESAIMYRKNELAQNNTFKRLSGIFEFDKSAYNADLIADLSIVLGRDIKGDFE